MVSGDREFQLNKPWRCPKMFGDFPRDGACDVCLNPCPQHVPRPRAFLSISEINGKRSVFELKRG